MFPGSVSPKSNFPALLEVGRPKKIQTHILMIYIYTLCLSKIPQRPPFTTSKSLNFFHEMRQFDPPFHFHCHNGKRHLCNKATNPGVDFFVIHLSDLGKFPSKKHVLRDFSAEIAC